MPNLAGVDARIVELIRQPTLAVRIQQPMSELDLSKAFDRYMPAVGQKAAESGATIAGAPFGRYHRFGPDIVDVEIGFPVDAWPGGVPALEDCRAGRDRHVRAARRDRGSADACRVVRHVERGL